MKTSKLDYKEQRDRELYTAFCRHYRRGVSVDEAVHMAINSPCSRYWISTENAFKRISAMLRGKRYSAKGDRQCRLSLIAHIMASCHGDYTSRNIERVVYSPAPQFFLAFSTAKRYIYYILKDGKYKKTIHSND